MRKNLDNLLFHGTTGDFDIPRPGGYDGCFWTARTSTIAQTYIPAAGLTLSTGYIGPHDLDCHVRPERNGPLYSVVRQMGHEAREVEWDQLGRGRSWSIPPGYPTYRQVFAHIENVLRYKCVDGRSPNSPVYMLKSKGWLATEQRDLIAPADYKMPGWLWVVSGWDDLKIYDFSTGRESDLTSPDYHRTGMFSRLEQEGYDGVAIRDYAQSKTHGNVEHEAIGFFARAIPSLTLKKLPAVNFDWPEDRRCCDIEHSPEFLEWAAKRERRASLSL